MNWELTIFFRMTSGDILELASYRSCETQVVTQWLCAGRARKDSSLYIAIYDEKNCCLDTKRVSAENINPLLALCAKAYSKKSHLNYPFNCTHKSVGWASTHDLSTSLCLDHRSNFFPM